MLLIVGLGGAKTLSEELNAELEGVRAFMGGYRSRYLEGEGVKIEGIR